MAIDLGKYGITDVTEIVRNPSYEELYKDEMDPGLTGFDKGVETELGAVNVMTGIYTGRSPKDKFIVMDENSKDTVWWTSDEYPNDNHVASQECWNAVKEIAKKELSGKKLYVVDAFCGANKDTRMAVRFIMEVAWQAHFIKNMFIQPTAEELETYEPDFVVYNASKAKVENYKELGLNSETAVVFNITTREQATTFIDSFEATGLLPTPLRGGLLQQTMERALALRMDVYSSVLAFSLDLEAALLEIDDRQGEVYVGDLVGFEPAVRSLSGTISEEQRCAEPSVWSSMFDTLEQEERSSILCSLTSLTAINAVPTAANALAPNAPAAHDSQPPAAPHDDDEDIALARLSEDEARALLRSTEARDAKTIAALGCYFGGKM